jgi:D-xylose transport system substrate-binding protein
LATEEAVSWAKGDALKSTAAISNGNKTVPGILWAPVALTKDNIKQTIIKDGFQNLGMIAKGLPKEKWLP